MSPRPDDRPYALAVWFAREDASTTLFFGHLAGGMRGTLRVAHYRQPDLAKQLSGASAIILVRDLFELDPVIWFARLAGVALYYFVDDNFMLLREQPGMWSRYVEPYTAERERTPSRILWCAGVVAGTGGIFRGASPPRPRHAVSAGRLVVDAAASVAEWHGCICRLLRRVAPPRCTRGLRAAGHSPGGRLRNRCDSWRPVLVSPSHLRPA